MYCIEDTLDSFLEERTTKACLVSSDYFWKQVEKTQSGLEKNVIHCHHPGLRSFLAKWFTCRVFDLSSLKSLDRQAKLSLERWCELTADGKIYAIKEVVFSKHQLQKEKT